MLPQSMESCLSTLDKFMLQTHPVCASAVIPEKPKHLSTIVKTPPSTVVTVTELKSIG